MIPMLVEAHRIAEILGGAQVLGRTINSIFDLGEAVEQGLPKSSLRSSARHAHPDPSSQRQLIYQIVPEATYKRRHDRLSAVESERTERLARVIAVCHYVWDDVADSRRFLASAHPALGGKTPLQAALSELGARQVEELLAKIFHGLPA